MLPDRQGSCPYGRRGLIQLKQIVSISRGMASQALRSASWEEASISMFAGVGPAVRLLCIMYAALGKKNDHIFKGRSLASA